MTIAPAVGQKSDRAYAPTPRKDDAGTKAKRMLEGHQ